MRVHLSSRFWVKAAAAVLVLAAGAVTLVSGEKPPFTEQDKAFYADEAMVNFVRPGLVFAIQNVDIATDGTVKVTFSMTDPKGLPLDRDGITTPGTVSSSFLIAAIPKGGRWYQDYNTRIKTSTYPPTAGKQAKQAGTDSGGTYAKVSDGVYTYTFGTKIAGYDKTATHTVGLYGSRNLTEFDLGTNYATTLKTFVPDGSAVKEVRDVISTSSCNKCHGDLNFHGGSRKGNELCVMCHTPAYKDVTNVNPETGNTIDMTVMAHKIHMGANLPSVKAGKPYQIVGFGNAVSDFSDVNLPSNPTRCYFCHETKNTASQKNNYATKPGQQACGSCHDNIVWSTGEGHLGLSQVDDSRCTVCHIPQGEIDFDVSVKGAHVYEEESTLLSGLIAEIKSVENTKAGQKPIVNFTIKKKDGSVWTMAALNRVALVMSGPTTDYVSPTTNGYVTEDPKTANAPLTGDTYRYTFNTAIPADAKGTWTIGIEARVFETVLQGTGAQKEIEYGAPNKVVNFNVEGGAVVARRATVSTDTCNGCHASLSLHGTNRNKVEQCVLCHNPLGTDVARRPAAQAPAESIDFNLMVHRIHAGEEQSRTYTVYGFGNTPHNYNEIVFPAPLNNCTMCHLSGTYTLPTKASEAKIVDPRGYLNPTYAATGACLSCHTGKDTASHALANTTTLGESCAACHGTGKDYDVAKVHAQ